MRKALIAFLLTPALAIAQPPPGYYDNAQGLTGQALRSALRDIIDNHNVQSNASLWGHYYNTDAKPNGKVWDMYSDIPSGTPAYEFTFGTDQCGNYGQEGDCYNREHTFPQSWFSSNSPMVTDMFHVYPMDGYMNGQRGNLPYGEVTSPTFVGSNGSLKGPSSYPGYTGFVFEPIDPYKGDLARTYFYMMTRYMSEANGWTSDMMSGGDLNTWATNLLIQWHIDDPVSPKEIDRNNGVFGIQQNRNPFIDDPSWVADIWTSTVGVEELNDAAINAWVSNGQLFVEGVNARSLQLQVLDITGRTILSQVVNEQVTQLPDGLRSGVYFALLGSEGPSTTIRFIQR